MESLGTTPSLSSPRNSHDLVVCNSCPLFRNTDTTFGFSAPIKTTQQYIASKGHVLCYPISKDDNKAKESGKTIHVIHLLAMSCACSSSSTTAKPLLCLLYE